MTQFATASAYPSPLKILWIDDEPQDPLNRLLVLCGCDVECMTTGAAGLERARCGGFDVIMLDVRLGDMSGLSVLRRLGATGISTPILMVTGYYYEDEVKTEAFQAGAAAFAYKPFPDERELAWALRVVMSGKGESPLLTLRGGPSAGDRHARGPWLDAVDCRRTPVTPPFGIVAVSARMRGVVDWIGRMGPTHAAVLLTGETGTGKDLVARALHEASPRRGRCFAPINCAAIPETLLDAELFGHRRGAFTGADTDHPGLFETADGGTLFLDEIAELALPLQAHLLRVLDGGEVRRLGDARTRQVDVRVITATNRPLEDEVARGRFRKDLYFRLAVAKCHLPPLRERLEDLEPLVHHWLPQLAARDNPRVRGVSREALALLRAHRWPGNVRELRNVLAQAVCTTSDDVLDAQDVTAALSESFTPFGARGRAARSDVQPILAALESNRWNRTQTAHQLGIGRTTLWRRLRRIGGESSWPRQD